MNFQGPFYLDDNEYCLGFIHGRERMSVWRVKTRRKSAIDRGEDFGMSTAG